ncbi:MULTISPECIES: hypothetical protein [Paenibacillus]|uniref:hypothetical protein n=1 Tax=Paenibacillus TaxID=44249 RepID=UPI0022B910E8|nr:hypothetical protein [Paenibacillus caseinilyticus]MCZ8522016.1 hypothetical protein [Paenibacillus caseinilyticus]
MWMSLIESSARSAIELLIDAVRLLEETKRSGLLGTDYIQHLSTDIKEMELEVASLLGAEEGSGEMDQLFHRVYSEEMTIDDFISRTLLETA